MDSCRHEAGHAIGGHHAVPHRGRRQAGYSLPEVITVVTIVSLMVALGIGSLSPVRSQTAARRGAEELQQRLMAARKRAVTSGRCYRVDLTDAAGTVVAAGAPGTVVRLRRYLRAGCDFPAPPGSPQPVDTDFDETEAAKLPDGVSARIVPSPEALDFLPTGRPKLGPGETRLRLSLTFLQDQLLVDVSPTGVVCIQPATGAGTCP